MKNTMKKSMLSRVVLLASLITATSTYTNNAENEALMTSFGSFVYAVEKNIADLVNSSVKATYNTCDKAFEKTFLDITRKIESITRSTGDALTQDIYDIIDYALQHFSIVHGVIKKYNGKPASEARSLGEEIKKNFNTEKIFSEITSKLKALKCKALKANEDCLAKKIETIIIMIEKKRKEWNAKSDVTLLAGLIFRMGCK